MGDIPAPLGTNIGEVVGSDAPIEAPQRRTGIPTAEVISSEDQGQGHHEVLKAIAAKDQSTGQDMMARGDGATLDTSSGTGRIRIPKPGSLESLNAKGEKANRELSEEAGLHHGDKIYSALPDRDYEQIGVVVAPVSEEFVGQVEPVVIPIPPGRRPVIGSNLPLPEYYPVIEGIQPINISISTGEAPLPVYEPTDWEQLAKLAKHKDLPLGVLVRIPERDLVCMATPNGLITVSNGNNFIRPDNRDIIDPETGDVRPLYPKTNVVTPQEINGQPVTTHEGSSPEKSGGGPINVSETISPIVEYRELMSKIYNVTGKIEHPEKLHLINKPTSKIRGGDGEPDRLHFGTARYVTVEQQIDNLKSERFQAALRAIELIDRIIREHEDGTNPIKEISTVGLEGRKGGRLGIRKRRVITVEDQLSRFENDRERLQKTVTEYTTASLPDIPGPIVIPRPESVAPTNNTVLRVDRYEPNQESRNARVSIHGARSPKAPDPRRFKN